MAAVLPGVGRNHLAWSKLDLAPPNLRSKVLEHRDHDNRPHCNGTPTLIRRSPEQNNNAYNSQQSTLATSIRLRPVAAGLEAMRSDKVQRRKEEEGAQALYPI